MTIWVRLTDLFLVMVLLKAVSLAFLRAVWLGGTKSWEFLSESNVPFLKILKTYFENKSDVLGLFYVTVMLLARESWDFIL